MTQNFNDPYGIATAIIAIQHNAIHGFTESCVSMSPVITEEDISVTKQLCKMRFNATFDVTKPYNYDMDFAHHIEYIVRNRMVREIHEKCADVMTVVYGERVEQEVQNCWIEKWLPIVAEDGVIDMSMIKNELSDYQTLLENVPKVYHHVTNGLMSSPNYLASEVIRVADEARENDIRDMAFLDYLVTKPRTAFELTCMIQEIIEHIETDLNITIDDSFNIKLENGYTIGVTEKPIAEGMSRYLTITYDDGSILVSPIGHVVEYDYGPDSIIDIKTVYMTQEQFENIPEFQG